MTAFHQRNVSLTALDGGGFVATWQSTNGDGGTTGDTGIVARIWDPAAGFGDSFVVNETVPGGQNSPDVIQLDDGRLLFGWESAPAGQPLQYRPHVRLFDANGTALGHEAQISSIDGRGLYNIELGQLKNGMIVASWFHDITNGAEVNRFAYFDPDNLGDVTTVTVTADTTDTYVGTDVLPLANGSYLNIAVGYDPEVALFYLHDAAGKKLSGPIRISQDTDFRDHESDLDAVQLSDGRIVAVWDNAAFGPRIQMQIFDKSLVAQGTTVQVSPAGMSAVDPAIAATPDGGFVVVYNGASTIRLMRYDRLGEAIDDAFDVSQAVEKGNGFPEVETLENGAVVVSWTRFTDDFYTDVFGRVLDPALYGSGIRDRLTDKVGANWMDGRGGNDILNGLGGNDIIYGDRGHDKIFGGNGRDRLFGEIGNDTLDGGGQNDRLLGAAGADVLKGGDGNDLLRGGQGNDTLQGNKGNDTLKGEDGNDILTGGLGRDVFVFGKQEGTDTVTDFTSGADRIDLRAFGFAGKADAMSHFDDFGNASDGMARFVSDGTTVVFQGVDLSGIASADLIV
ncbi:MAG: M10 family metallopeptidase C-terminal domain-containing protein [Pseudooceanicola sp.]|nr:M10 family metallopeptidase C-terminal domain-containing protein [Pseudooceanicola sp.]